MVAASRFVRVMRTASRSWRVLSPCRQEYATAVLISNDLPFVVGRVFDIRGRSLQRHVADSEPESSDTNSAVPSAVFAASFFSRSLARRLIFFSRFKRFFFC